MRVVKHRHGLPREVAPSLGTFKVRLDGAWSTLLWWKGSLPRAGGWNWVICKVPSNPNQPVVLSPDQQKFQLL